MYPLPEIGINDVLIKVKRSAICGTDLHIYNWDAWAEKTIPVPMVVGHEFVGEVAAVGTNVNDFHLGQVVSGEGHVVCGRCRNCMAGKRHLCAMHQRSRRQPARSLRRIPGAAHVQCLGASAGSTWMWRPCSIRFGNAVHTALQYDLLGEDVLITGAGPIGVMAAAVCRHAGARHVVMTDVIRHALTLAEKLGATRTVNASREITGRRSTATGDGGGL